jgi:hypothetical protein
MKEALERSVGNGCMIAGHVCVEGDLLPMERRARKDKDLGRMPVARR